MKLRCCQEGYKGKSGAHDQGGEEQKSSAEMRDMLSHVEEKKKLLVGLGYGTRDSDHYFYRLVFFSTWNKDFVYS